MRSAAEIYTDEILPLTLDEKMDFLRFAGGANVRQILGSKFELNLRWLAKIV